MAEGHFTAEITPVEIASRKGPITFERDEHPKATSAEALAALKPVFQKDGTVTAGNASGINDGAAALILSDAALAKALGATHVLPLLALTLKPRDIRLRGDDLRLACHRAVVSAARQALPLAGDLARAAARLRAVAPKLRAKAAGRAVDLFLSRDALVPGALAFMSDRAARRLCDRLVALGAVRELTGRDTFRLYGV